MIFVGFVVLYVIFLGDDIFVYELVSIFSILIFVELVDLEVIVWLFLQINYFFVQEEVVSQLVFFMLILLFYVF